MTDDRQARPVLEMPPEHRPPVLAEGMTLRDALSVLRRRLWLVILLAVVAAVGAYVVASLQPDVYEATTDLIYEQELDIANPLTGQSYTDPYLREIELNSVGSILASSDMLARTQKRLEGSGWVLDEYAVSAAPAGDVSSDSSLSTTNIVRVSVQGPDPEGCAAVANAYADAFVAWRTQRVQEQISEAIDALQVQLESYKTDTSKLGADYLVLQQRLQDMRIYKSTATGNFRVLVAATAPAEPFAPQPLRSAAMGLAVGLFAGVGLAFLLEVLDTRLRSADDVTRILQRPILGRIPEMGRETAEARGVMTLRDPESVVADAFRLVRTNLRFTSLEGAVRSFMVTSCQPGEGKSVTVANLAAAFALAGRKVVVVDGDLRRPRQHALFGLSNSRGVSTVLTGESTLVESVQRVYIPSTDERDQALTFVAWARGSGNDARFYVLPSGPLPPNPGEMVSSHQFAKLIDDLRNEAEIVIVDCPALLAVGDSAALADKVDGLVFLVDLKATKRPALVRAAEQVGKLPCQFLGVVLRGEATREAGYNAYSYGHGYRTGKEAVKP
ncbi:MAG: Wzz/FepE/Etk N-terminal domain-containing protein [Thermoleophilia bacterium]